MLPTPPGFPPMPQLPSNVTPGSLHLDREAPRDIISRIDLKDPMFNINEALVRAQESAVEAARSLLEREFGCTVDTIQYNYGKDGAIILAYQLRRKEVNNTMQEEEATTPSADTTPEGEQAPEEQAPEGETPTETPEETPAA